MTSQQPINRKQAAGAAVVTGVAQAYKILINFGSGVMLARLLTPADFGLIAMVSTVLAFVLLVQDLGLNQATIQRAQISDAQSSALFWMTNGLSLALGLLVALSGPAAARFFGESRLIGLMPAFGFLVCIGGITSQPFALLNRDLRFKTIAWIDVLSTTTSAIVGVAIAWWTSSYWALFVSQLAAAFVSIPLILISGRFWPSKPSFEGAFREIVNLGLSISGFNVVNYFARNGDNLLIGRFYGSAQLGLYDRAYRLLLFPLEQIRNPLGRVMLPVLSRLKTDPERYRNAYIECVSLMMVATQPGLIFLIIFANEVFGILYGPNWLPAAPIFQWLGICGLQQILTATTGWLFISQGRGSDYFRLGLFNAIFTVVSFVIGLPWGPLGVAIAYTVVSYLVHVPATIWWLCRGGPVRLQDLISGTLPHLLATFLGGAVLLGAAISMSPPHLIGCIGLVLLSYAVYGLVMVAFPEKLHILRTNFRVLVDIFSNLGRAALHVNSSRWRK